MIMKMPPLGILTLVFMTIQIGFCIPTQEPCGDRITRRACIIFGRENINDFEVAVKAVQALNNETHCLELIPGIDGEGQVIGMF